MEHTYPGLEHIPLRQPASRKYYYWLTLCGVLVALMIGAYTQLTFFVIQPIGAIPDGRTVVLWRRSAALSFIDSADAICDRLQGGVSLWCRAISIGAVAKNNPIILRLPYSHSLYLISTGGEEYDR